MELPILCWYMSICVEDLRHFCHIFQVPKTCENFIKLCSTGYYDNTSKKTENFQVVSFFLCLSRCYCSYVWYKQLICIFIFLLVFHRSIRNFMVCAKVASFLTYSSCACCLVWNITSAGNWVYQQSPQGLIVFTVEQRSCLCFYCISKDLMIFWCSKSNQIKPLVDYEP